ncbi:xanthine phosphoribosyltransferase [Telmatospirillum siberiense]|uniref:Xanthine phosphoribosyltransferase n=1 Tax=Telmatospirillum siberiense TaxID=382514 RepID=A0A2N3Q0Q6_9PROT|nr:xanthine phosphoribosyltransferase [Telmatospirillum siberiense]PKU26237.1 xanthine phosphoribosyltransferase [Telmatospirillum siberiense]
MAQDFTGNAAIKIGWDALHRDSVILSQKLRTKGPFKGIIAVARGGLVPAAIVARELDIRLVDTVCVSSYDDTVQRDDLLILKPVEGDGTGWLVIDDLVDSGKTFRQLRKMLPKAHYATVYVKPVGQPVVDTTVIPIDQEIWLVFPWDDDPANWRLHRG